jgi:hypothetical protein
MRLKSLLIPLAAAAIGGLAHAQAQPRQLVGTAGYLSEWEVRGTVSETMSPAGSEFSGPVVWKHIGICSANGPEEKRGVIKAQINRTGPIPRIDATVSLGKAQCTFKGDFSGDFSGNVPGNSSDRTSVVMDCSDAKGVPLTFSFDNR